MYSTMKKYVNILRQLEEDLDNETVDMLEEQLEELYYDLSEEELVLVETENIEEIDTEDDEE